jgi:hypothetical protein
VSGYGIAPTPKGVDDATASVVGDTVEALFRDRFSIEGRLRGAPESGPDHLIEALGDLGLFELGGISGSTGGRLLTLDGVVADKAGRELIDGALLHQQIGAIASGVFNFPSQAAEAIIGGQRRVEISIESARGTSHLIPFANATADLIVISSVDGRARIVNHSDLVFEEFEAGWASPFFSEVKVNVIAGASMSDLMLGDSDALQATAHALVAMYMLGAANRLLENTIAYVKQRKQFGVAIGSFQAIKHSLSDVHIDLLHARALTSAALRELEGGGAEGSTLALMAKVASASAAHRGAERCLQAWGGIGFTWDANVHLFLKMIGRLAQWPVPLLILRRDLRNRLYRQSAGPQVGR